MTSRIVFGSWLVPAMLPGLLMAQDARPLVVSEGERPRFDYHDAHDGRSLADVRVSLSGRGKQRSLQMVISAVGPLVDPIPRFRGVRGANRYTAEERDLILTHWHSAGVRTRHAAHPQARAGSISQGLRGQIPERRIGDDGRIDVSAQKQYQPRIRDAVGDGSMRTTVRALALDMRMETTGTKK